MSNLLERLNQRFFSHRNKKVSSDALQTKTSSKWTDKSPNVKVGQLTLVCRELQDRNEALEARVAADELLALLRGEKKVAYGSLVAGLACVAGVYEHFGQFEDAVPIRREILLLQEGRHGPASTEATSAMRFLAYTLRSANELSESLELDRRALLSLEAQEGAGSKTTLSVQLQIGITLARLDQFAESSEVLQSVLVATGPMTAEGLSAATWIAHNRKELGDIEGALGLQEETLANWTSKLGREDRSTLQSADSLAVMLWDAGLRDRADQMFSATLAIRERTYGDLDPETIQTREWLEQLRLEG